MTTSTRRAASTRCSTSWRFGSRRNLIPVVLRETQPNTRHSARNAT
jgi:hypothetical protein